MGSPFAAATGVGARDGAGRTLIDPAADQAGDVVPLGIDASAARVQTCRLGDPPLPAFPGDARPRERRSETRHHDDARQLQ